MREEMDRCCEHKHDQTRSLPPQGSPLSGEAGLAVMGLELDCFETQSTSGRQDRERTIVSKKARGASQRRYHELTVEEHLFGEGTF